jgi:hypothetical protein
MSKAMGSAGVRYMDDGRFRRHVVSVRPGPNANHGRLLDAEFHGDRIGRLEANAPDITGKPIRIFRHHLHGLGAIGFEYANGPCHADAMAVQEHHDLPNNLLLGPAATILSARTGPMLSTSRSDAPRLLLHPAH